MITATLPDDRIDQTNAYAVAQLPKKAEESAMFSHELLDTILDFVRPGVKESEVKQFALDLFTSHGIERIWHQPYVRFADHTMLTFMDKTQDDYVLRDDDIAFVDIGVVKSGIEGDAGRTIVFGNSAEHHRVQKASEAIFTGAKQFWKQHNPSGIELYQHIYALADEMDVEFNLDPAGHLIGEFPHRGWKKGINNYPEKVAAGCWILEIQICDKSRSVGAFYEDLLY
jgi:Xaa-Pro aminopeptidase